MPKTSALTAAKRMNPRFCLPQEPFDGSDPLRLRHFELAAGFDSIAGGKADIVELDFIEPRFTSLDRQSQRILPGFSVCWIEPWTVKRLFGIGIRPVSVLERDHPGDQI